MELETEPVRCKYKTWNLQKEMFESIVIDQCVI